MYTLLDNLTATLLAGTILLILLVMQTRAAEMSVQQTANTIAKKYSLTFADWLQDDLLKLGKNLNPDEQVAFDNVNTDSENRTTSFTFYRDSLRSSDTLRIATRYVLGDESASEGMPLDTLTLDGNSVQLFRLTRQQKMWPVGTARPTAWTNTGQSAGLLEHFEIRMFDENGTLTLDPDAAKQMRAQFALLPPFVKDDTPVDAMHWGTSLMLRN